MRFPGFYYFPCSWLRIVSLGSNTDSTDTSFKKQRAAELNRAFVLMQYFGYLRRNPDDPQGVDFGGWKFWLDKLNYFNGNFQDAEMVKAFLFSLEYRRRFGP